MFLIVLFGLLSFAESNADANPAAVASPEANPFFFGKKENKCKKECRTEYYKHCEPYYADHCETYYENHCEQQYKEHCEYEKKQHCETTYEEECSYEKKQHCETHYKEHCKPSYEYGKHCEEQYYPVRSSCSRRSNSKHAHGHPEDTFNVVNYAEQKKGNHGYHE